MGTSALRRPGPTELLAAPMVSIEIHLEKRRPIVKINRRLRDSDWERDVERMRLWLDRYPELAKIITEACNIRDAP